MPAEAYPHHTSPAVGAVEHSQQIAEARQAATAAKLAELLDDPRIATLIETGQLTTGGALAQEQARGTQEPPVSQKATRNRVNRRGGRAYPEPSDSELDPNWNASVPPTTEDAARNAKNVAEIKRSRAAEAYQRELQTLGVGDAVAHLRNKGYRPDPATHGKTVVPL